MKLTAKLFLFAVLCLWIGVFIVRYPFSFESSLIDIFPKKDDALPTKIMEKYSSDINLIIEADNFNTAYATATQITKFLNTKKISYKSLNTDVLDDITSLMQAYPYSFLSNKDANLLKLKKTDDIFKHSLYNITSSFIPSVFPIKEDPFSLLNNYVLQINPPSFSWKMKDGFLWQNKNAKDYILIQIPTEHIDIKKISQQLADIKKFQPLQSRVYLSGAPVHTIQMFQKSKNEINLISILSVITLITLTFILFRKVKIVFQTAFNLILAFIVGLGSVLLIFPKVHFLSIAFSASLIGICIDYSFHYFSQDSEKMQKNLRYSFITSILCFVPLLFSSLSLLRQIAVFTIFGLIATYIWIIVQPAIQNKSQKNSVFSLPKYFLGILTIFILTGLPFVRTQNSPQILYQPTSELKQAESLFHTLSNQKIPYLFIARGATLQQALEAEEKVKEQYPFFSLSTFLPSVKKQQQNQKMIQKLYEAQSENIEKVLKERPVFTPHSPFTEKDLTDTQKKLSELFIVHGENQIFTIAPITQKIPNLPPNTNMISIQEYMADQLNACAQESYFLLTLSFILLSVVLFAIYRKKMIMYILPPLFGVLGSVSFLSLCSQPLTFFHILSLFIVIGLGMDYAIFHLNNDYSKAVFYSFLSSFIGFGLLCFLSFKPLFFMGSTIATGLAITYIASLSFGFLKKVKTQQTWYKQKEQSAGKFRLQILWYFYRLIGLTGLKFILYIITFFIYLFADSARKASKKYQTILKIYCQKHKKKTPKISTYSHILSYAFSLAEKMSVICDKKIRFKITINPDENWISFKDNIINNQGMFLLCSHLGNIEALAGFSYQFPNLPQRKLNALMQMGQSSVFRQFIEQHQISKAFNLFPTEDLNFDVIMNLYEKLLAGELVMMAADRTSAQSPLENLSVKLLDKQCLLPKGAFVFARKMNVPAYAIAFMRVKKNEYRLFLKQLDLSLNEQKLAEEYICFIEALLLKYPKQWYNFYSFFKD